MNKKLLVLTLLLPLGAHAENDDFVFAPGYMPAAGSGSVQFGVGTASTSQKFITPYGYTGTVEAEADSEQIAARYGITARDKVYASVAHRSRYDIKYTLDAGPEFDTQGPLKYNPALGYEHSFSAADSAFKVAASLDTGRNNAKPGANYVAPGMDFQYRTSPDLLLHASLDYAWYSNAAFAKSSGGAVGFEYRALPALTLAAGLAETRLEATPTVSAHQDNSAGLAVHIEVLPGQYLSLGLTDAWRGSTREQGWLFKNSSDGVGASVSYYIGF